MKLLMSLWLVINNFKKHLSLEILAIIIIALAVLMRILNLDSREFWYDEVLSLLLSTGQKNAYHTPGDTPVVLAEYSSLLSLPVEVSLLSFITTVKQLLTSLLGGEPHPPLFFLSQHFWLRFFGNGEAAIRGLNTLISIAAIGSTYGLGKLLLGHRGGLLLAALLAVNPFYLFHSLNVRMYAPLVFWGTLSAWSLLSLIYRQDNPTTKSRHPHFLWNFLLIASVAAGLLTFYLYAYWVIALATLVLYLDRRHWWQHALRLGAGVLLTIPWVLRGTLIQLSNADLNRFGSVKEGAISWLLHLKDTIHILGIHLVVGDWVTSLPPVSILLVGCMAVFVLGICATRLWKSGEKENLGIALILGILPLMLALAVDVITQKFTLGFGWGRSMIMILPGCLLLLVLGIERGTPRQWRTSIAAGLLLLYLSIGVADFSLRQRSMFHSVADLILQEPTQSTLIAMNSKAWGHVMRLAYYIPPRAPVMLLAEHPANLANTLQQVLDDKAQKYARVIWLDSADPVWSRLKTETEIQNTKQQIQQILSSQWQLNKTLHLSGTMSIDKFNINLYSHSFRN
ncbi:MAG: glycosyltransferase family 39 protein [Calothrix sp. MO_192.B10]|nr:glycosyltransferase family 39 protein [Calothrix sp. MO_192.B10]